MSVAGGSGVLYLMCSLSIFLAFLQMASIKGGAGRKRETKTGDLQDRTVGAAIKFIWRTKVLFCTMSLDLLAGFFGGAIALMPVYAKDLLHVGSLGLGSLRSAPEAGALLMGFIFAQGRPPRHTGKLFILAILGFGVSSIAFGLSRFFWLSLLSLFVIGALDAISVLVRQTLLQVKTPDPLLGRVSALSRVFIGISNEMGEFESGLTAWLWGPVLSVVLGGIVTVVSTLAVALFWPKILELDGLHRSA